MLVLFDIDGTMLSSEGIGVRSIEQTGDDEPGSDRNDDVCRFGSGHCQGGYFGGARCDHKPHSTIPQLSREPGVGAGRAAGATAEAP